MKNEPMMNVTTNHRRSLTTSPRSAANTPIWQVTDDSTRTVVLIAAKTSVRWLVASFQTCGPWTARTVKYMANSAAKNMSSDDSHTMVPTATLLGRSGAAGAPLGVTSAVAVATRGILPGEGAVSDPDPPVRHSP